MYVPEDICAPDLRLETGWIVRVTLEYRDGVWRVPCGKPIEEILPKHDDWLLKVDATDNSNLDNLVEIVGSFDKSKRFAVFTTAQNVARTLRKKAPQWLFAADPITLLRLQMFESLWIETAMDFWPDFVITPLRDFHLRERAALELTKRHRRIVWDADHGTPAPDFPFHGIMTTRPEQFGLLK